MENNLAVRLRDNDEKALDNIIEKYSSYVFTVVRNFSASVLTEEDIEEIVIDVFVRLWISRDRVQTERPLLPYLSVIAKNCVKNKFRQQNENLKKEAETDLISGSFLESFENSLALQDIFNALESVSDNQRELFIRFYFYGEKLGRIAEILNITESNAKTSLCRTRKKVKKYLTERGYDQYEGFK